MNVSWNNFLDVESKKTYFIEMEKFLEEERLSKKIYPKKEDVLNAFLFTELKDVKVVILGQDPYYRENQAHGLSFSVGQGVKIPPSLRNMYKELETDIEGFILPNHGDLTSWAKQGVFLLNNVLTVEDGLPDSHKKIGWGKFTDNAIKYINENCENVVFILWGGNARKKSKFLDKQKHFVIESAHPSPLSSYRGFFGSCPFSKSNEYLLKSSRKEIDWKIK